MNNDSMILALDQGTTSSRAIVFNKSGDIQSVGQQEFKQYYPNNGWVEHDPEEIWQTTLSSAKHAIEESNGLNNIVALGITNQRETVVVWDRQTSEPIYNAIVWQDRRTADTCKALVEDGNESFIRNKTGLLCDPYFSATKIAWILDNVEDARERANKGELAVGTIDTFLIWRLTKGKVHATDATNASRTNLYNIHDGQWDEELLKLFNVPKSMLPEVKNSADDYGVADAQWFGSAIPIGGVAGDQQAATIGQACFQVGDIKSTYGTGCFALMNTGEKAVPSNHRMLTTIAYQLNGKTTYALEGSIFIAGAAVQWCRDELGIIQNAQETEALAKSLENNDGVYLVPAFTGLGAPYWEPDARAALVGLTRGSGRAHIARAALESVCYQTYDLCKAIAADASFPQRIRVDGGMVANNWLMQYLADILNVTIDRPVVTETTALGAAYLAGLSVGLYSDLNEIQKAWQLDASYTPSMSEQLRTRFLSEWGHAINQVLLEKES